MPATFYDVLAVLAPPAGAHGVGEGVFGFLGVGAARPLRRVSKGVCEDVRNARWLDKKSRIKGSALRQWRASFPNARYANVVGRGDVTDADLAFLSGVGEVHADLRGCKRITDAGLAHIRGAVCTLNMSGCKRITDAGLAHLTGIHTLDMSWCKRITDAGLAHLTGIYTLIMHECTLITGAGLAHLTGIHTLNMWECRSAAIAAARALGLPATDNHTNHMFVFVV